MFSSFGVSEHAESAYRHLLTTPVLDDLDQVLGEDAATAVAELLDRGLLRHGPDGRLRVEPPERALDLLIAREEEALARRRAALQDLRGGVVDLVAEFVNGRTESFGGLIERVVGADGVRSRLYQLAVSAQREVWTTNPGPAPSRRAIEASRAMDRLSRARGVRSRSIFATEVMADEGMREYLAEVVAAGDEVRLHPDPPVLLFVVDGETALVPADTAKAGAAALVLHSLALVQPMTVLFQQLWQASRPYLAQEAWDGEEDRLRRIVALLSEGQKDEAIARRLDVSVRTVRRLISLAVERMGAQSRFQAGVQAVRRGWVAPEA